MADQENESFLSPKAKRVMLTSSAALLVALAGTGTYYWQTQKTETASVETTKSEKNKGKPAKDITLNTDDNQVKDDRDNQPKRRATEISPDNTGDDFALNDDTDSPVYLVDASNPDEPITQLFVDPDKVVIPTPPPPEIPKGDEPSLPILPPNDDSVPDLTGDNPNNQENSGTEDPGTENPNPDQPGDQTDDGTTTPPDNGGGDNGGNPGDQDPGTPGGPTDPTDPGGPGPTDPTDPGNGGGDNQGDVKWQDMFPKVQLVVPETVYERVVKYHGGIKGNDPRNKDLYNVMSYGPAAIDNVDDEKVKEDLIQWIVDAAAETKTKQLLTQENLATYQMISSLGFSNKELDAYKAEVRNEIYKKFAKEEIEIYLSKKVNPENPDETNQDQAQQPDQEKAQQILYYIGTYNKVDQLDGEPNDDLNPSDYSHADRVVMDAAFQDMLANNLAAALNKYQLLVQYAPAYRQEANGYIQNIVNNKINDERSKTEPRIPGQYEEIPAGEELKTMNDLFGKKEYVRIIEQGGNENFLSEYPEVKPVVDNASRALLNETNILIEKGFIEDQDEIKNDVIRNYQVLTEESGVPQEVSSAAGTRLDAYYLMLQAEESADPSEKVILASESIDKWGANPKDSSPLQVAMNKIADKLLKKAESYSAKDMDKEEKIYDLLSTTPNVDNTIKNKAFDRKKAFGYYRKAKSLEEQNSNDINVQYDVIFYGSESNSLYNKHQNDLIMISAAQKILNIEVAEESFQKLLKAYRNITSAVGMPNDVKADAKKRQEAIDDYNKAMIEKKDSHEKVVVYLNEATIKWNFMNQVLQSESASLLSEADKIKDKELTTAVSYYKTLLNSEKVSSEIKTEAKAKLTALYEEDKAESKPNNTSSSDNQKNTEVPPVKKEVSKEKTVEPSKETTNKKETEQVKTEEGNTEQESVQQGHSETPKEEVSEEEAQTTDATDNTPAEEEAPLPEAEQAVPQI